MKYLLGLFVVLLGFAGASAAQHGRASSHGNSHGGGTGSHGAVRERHAGKANPGHFNGDHGRHVTQEARGHYNGRRLDRGFSDQHFGARHSFYVNHRVFYDGRYRFWYGGLWFDFLDPWPDDWSDRDRVYMDYDDPSECYFLYDPRHPEGRLRIGVMRNY
jgi:hypothetical protein